MLSGVKKVLQIFRFVNYYWRIWVSYSLQKQREIQKSKKKSFVYGKFLGKSCTHWWVKTRTKKFHPKQTISIPFQRCPFEHKQSQHKITISDAPILCNLYDDDENIHIILLQKITYHLHVTWEFKFEILPKIFCLYWVYALLDKSVICQSG